MELRQGRRCGALAGAGGSVRWRVWAPRTRQVELVLLDGGRRRASTMHAEERGFFHLDLHEVPDGQRYLVAPPDEVP